MAEREVSLHGLDRLRAVTVLLQRARTEQPTAGLWEAADLQWWWRRPRSSDDLDQSVVLDEQGQPLATVALTDWGDRWSCEPLTTPDRYAALLPVIWAGAMTELDRLQPAVAETSIRDDDPVLADLAAAWGFAPSPARYAEAWMAAQDRPPVPELAAGYALSDRAATVSGPTT